MTLEADGKTVERYTGVGLDILEDGDGACRLGVVATYGWER